jgi:hypothetical protein
VAARAKARLANVPPGSTANHQRQTINGTPEDLEKAQEQLDAEAAALWESKWDDK